MKQSTVAWVAALAIALFALWFFKTHERVTNSQYTGFQGEARINPFLASELLLGEFEIEADSRSSLIPSDWLPDDNDTLVSRVSASFALGEEGELLLMWVANGGHLVLLPPRQDLLAIDEFLQYLEFPLIEVEPDDDEDSEEEGEDEGDEVFDYIVGLDTTFYRIDIPDLDYVSATLSDEKGVVAARREWGDGYVTIVADSKYFTNLSIGEFDHARLLLDAVAGYVKTGKVWFIYDAAYPSIFQLIWINAPYVVVSFAIAIILWLWSIMPKFGPGVLPDPPVRRSIIEHVEAAGRFVWRQHGARFIAKSSAAAVMHEAETRHPGISRLPAQGKAKQIAGMTGLAEKSILEVLLDQGELRHREFTHNMQALQRIRKEL